MRTVMKHIISNYVHKISMNWSEFPQGEFDFDVAKKITDELVEMYVRRDLAIKIAKDFLENIDEFTPDTEAKRGAADTLEEINKTLKGS